MKKHSPAQKTKENGETAFCVSLLFLSPPWLKTEQVMTTKQVLFLKNAAVALLVFLTVALSAQNSRRDSTALLLVDIQAFYFPGGFYPLVHPEKASAKASVLLNYFRKNHALVVHIKHATKKDSLIHADVAPLPGEKVITKHFANSFRGTGLLPYLKAHHIKYVVVAGMMTHMCVEATTRAAADLGFQVTLISDACATRDVVYRGDTVKARDVQLSTLGSIDRYYGKVMTVKEFIEGNYLGK